LKQNRIDKDQNSNIAHGQGKDGTQHQYLAAKDIKGKDKKLL
jgi:hypothetical protein